MCGPEKWRYSGAVLPAVYECRDFQRRILSASRNRPLPHSDNWALDLNAELRVAIVGTAGWPIVISVRCLVAQALRQRVAGTLKVLLF
jgi:hypothetical protein